MAVPPSAPAQRRVSGPNALIQLPGQHAAATAAQKSAQKPARPPGVPPSPPAGQATETTPLLPPAGAPVPSSAPVAVAKRPLSGLDGLDKPPTTWNELGVLVKTSVPLSAGLMLENALNTINILVAGRLGPQELAVAGNSSLLIMVTGEYGLGVGELKRGGDGRRGAARWNVVPSGLRKA